MDMCVYIYIHTYIHTYVHTHAIRHTRLNTHVFDIHGAISAVGQQAMTSGPGRQSAVVFLRVAPLRATTFSLPCDRISRMPNLQLLSGPGRGSASPHVFEIWVLYSVIFLEQVCHQNVYTYAESQ